LSDVLVVVVRYFGGTKLGIGGLIRAYRDAARAAIEAGAVEERVERSEMTFAIALEQVGEARALLARFGGELLAERYADCAELSVAVPADTAAAFRARVDDLARGSARWRKSGPAGDR
jgi:putative IMPACT (imprinted ancient) family translation regulator